MAKRLARGLLSIKSLVDTGRAARYGGFSTRTTGTQRGKPARNVFSVGFAPNKGREEEVSISGNASPAVQAYHFNRAKAELLGTRGASMAQGGWVDRTGTVQQDASVLLPKTAEGLTAAMHIGSYGKQEQIGNVGPSASNPYIGDIPVPEHLHRGQFATAEGDSQLFFQWADDPDRPMEPTVERGLQRPVDKRMVDVVRITPSRMEMVDLEGESAAKKIFGK